MDRSMIIDPHSSLWEADLVCVVHDISDDFLKGNSFLLLFKYNSNEF